MDNRTNLAFVNRGGGQHPYTATMHDEFIDDIIAFIINTSQMLIS